LAFKFDEKFQALIRFINNSVVAYFLLGHPICSQDKTHSGNLCEMKSRAWLHRPRNGGISGHVISSVALARWTERVLFILLDRTCRWGKFFWPSRFDGQT